MYCLSFFHLQHPPCYPLELYKHLVKHSAKKRSMRCEVGNSVYVKFNHVNDWEQLIHISQINMWLWGWELTPTLIKIIFKQYSGLFHCVFAMFSQMSGSKSGFLVSMLDLHHPHPLYDKSTAYMYIQAYEEKQVYCTYSDWSFSYMCYVFRCAQFLLFNMLVLVCWWKPSFNSQI